MNKFDNTLDVSASVYGTRGWDGKVTIQRTNPDGSDEVAFVDGLRLNAAKEVDAFATKAAAACGISEEDTPDFVEWLKREILKRRDGIEAGRKKPTGGKGNAGGGDGDAGGGEGETVVETPLSLSAEILEATNEELRRQAVEYLSSPTLLDSLTKSISRFIVGEDSLIRLMLLYGTSRLLKRPLSVLVTGSSSGGKSYLLETMAGLFPEESIRVATKMTESALAHMRPNDLRHTIIVAGERKHDQSEQQRDATRLLREMISSGKLTTMIPVKGENGDFRTLEKTVYGPIAFSESTTLQQIFAEDANRCIVMSVDESPEQTARIMRHVVAEDVGAEHVLTELQQLHHTMQRSLRQYEVSVPYGSTLLSMVVGECCNVVEMRRAFAQLVTAIRACTLFHQYQRSCDEFGQLVATIEDYLIVADILGEWFAGLLVEPLPAAAIAFHAKLLPHLGYDPSRPESAAQVTAKPFSLPQLVEAGLGKRTTCQRHLAALSAAGITQMVEQGSRGRGNNTVFKMSHCRPATTPKPVLPTADDLERAFTGEVLVQREKRGHLTKKPKKPR